MLWLVGPLQNKRLASSWAVVQQQKFQNIAEGREAEIEGRKVPSSSSALNWVPGSLSTVQRSTGPYSIYRNPSFRWVGTVWNGSDGWKTQGPCPWIFPGSRRLSGHLLSEVNSGDKVAPFKKFFKKKRETSGVGWGIRPQDVELRFI